MARPGSHRRLVRQAPPADTPPAGTGEVGRSTILWILLAVGAITLAVQWPALHANALSFDDSEYLVHNPRVRQPSLAHAGRFLAEVLEPSTVHGYYQPLTMISLMIDHALGGRPDHLMPFHRTSLLLHVANTLLLGWLLYRLIGCAWAAGIVALLFGVHPITVETIVWVGERKTVLASCFALCSLIAYVRYARTGAWPAYTVCVLTFVLALLAKPTATFLPVAMMLLDIWPLGRWQPRPIGDLLRSAWRTQRDKLPLLLIAAGSAIITYESQRRTAVAVNPGDEPISRLLLTVTHNLVFYPKQLLWPHNLSCHYPFPDPMTLSQPALLAGVIGTAVLAGVLLLSLRRTRAVLVGWLIWLVLIFPTLGVIGFTHVIAADKFNYLPAVGFALLLSAGITHLWRLNTLLPRAGIVAGTLAATIALSVGTRHWIGLWDNDEKLYSALLARTDRAPAVAEHLANALARQHRNDEAADLYREIIRRLPGHNTPYISLGVILAQRGQLDEAVQLYQQAIALRPDEPEAYNNLGNAQLKLNRPEDALANYQRAVTLKLGYADAQYNLANLLAQRGDRIGAIEHYRQALAVEPDLAAAHQNLAVVLWDSGQRTQALHHYREALRCRPGWWQVAHNMAWLLATETDPQVRDPAAAIGYAQQAVELTRRGEPSVLATLAIAQAEAGQRDAALATFHEAITLADQAGLHDLAEQIRRKMAEYP